jgi:hypothetical protein
MSTEQPQTPEQVQPEAPSLQLADMVLMLKVIQATAQRGAIRAEEMAEVGALHDSLVKFLTATGALQPAPQPQTPTEENQNG